MPGDEFAQDTLGLGIEEETEQVDEQPAGGEPEAGQEPFTGQEPANVPTWQQHGFVSAERYADHLEQQARQAQTELQRVQQERQQRQAEEQRLQTERQRQQRMTQEQQQEEALWNKFLETVPQEGQGFVQGLRQIFNTRLAALEEKRKADMEALYGVTEQRVAQIEQPITRALIERDFLAAYPEEMHVFKDEAVEDYGVARQMGYSHEQAKTYAAGRIQNRIQRYGIPQKPQQPASGNVTQIRRRTQMEGAGTAAPDKSTGKDFTKAQLDGFFASMGY